MAVRWSKAFAKSRSRFKNERATVKYVLNKYFRYKRIFSVGTHGITTYNPTNLENTNQVIFLTSMLKQNCDLNN